MRPVAVQNHKLFLFQSRLSPFGMTDSLFRKRRATFQAQGTQKAAGSFSRPQPMLPKVVVALQHLFFSENGLWPFQTKAKFITTRWQNNLFFFRKAVGNFTRWKQTLVTSKCQGYLFLFSLSLTLTRTFTFIVAKLPSSRAVWFLSFLEVFHLFLALKLFLLLNYNNCRQLISANIAISHIIAAKPT